jgi:hypothetical protein
VRPWCAALRRRPDDERGSFLIEACIAMLVFSVAILGVVSSMGSSLSLVGNSRQRSAGVAVAQERLERVHTIPYARVALYQQPTHDDDVNNPDNAVTADSPPKYTVEGTQTEPLVVDTANGALKHLDDPVTLGHTEFNIYQYVTWHDDPDVVSSDGHDYKRVVLVVTWKFPVHSGTSHRVLQSTYVGNGAVVVPPSTPTPTPSASADPSPSPSASPSAAPTASPGVCPGDPTAPAGAMDVVSGAGALQGYTNSTNVQTRLTATDQCSAPITAKLSNAAGECTTYSLATTLTSGVTSTVTWTIPAGDGSKTIHACFVDGAGNTSADSSAAIVLDQTKPSVPGNLRKSSCSINGNDRTITLTWNASTDANLLGYRVYKSINQGAFVTLLTTVSQSATDTDSKSYNSLTYRVTAYDKAGNESGVPNDLSFSKNSC